MAKKETQAEREFRYARERGIQFALDKFITIELGSSWNVELHEARLKELMEVVNGNTFNQTWRMERLNDARNKKFRDLLFADDKVGA